MRQRLNRADRQIQRIERSYARFVPNLEDHSIIVQIQNERQQVVKVRHKWRVPNWWGLAVGEALHHLRSSLDNLIWHVITANGVVPHIKADFLIAYEEEWFKRKAPTRLHGVPHEILAVIEQAQPYSRPDDMPLERHPFWVLNELDIIDKHHLLHVAAVIPQNVHQRVSQAELSAGMTITLNLDATHDGAEIMRFDFAHPHTEKVKMDSKARLVVQLAATERTPALAFTDLLRPLHSSTAGLVEAVATAAASTEMGESPHQSRHGGGTQPVTRPSLDS